MDDNVKNRIDEHLTALHTGLFGTFPSISVRHTVYPIISGMLNSRRPMTYLRGLSSTNYPLLNNRHKRHIRVIIRQKPIAMSNSNFKNIIKGMVNEMDTQSMFISNQALPETPRQSIEAELNRNMGRLSKELENLNMNLKRLRERMSRNSENGRRTVRRRYENPMGSVLYQ